MPDSQALAISEMGGKEIVGSAEKPTHEAEKSGWTFTKDSA